MSKRLLITGASGFVGYHLIKEAIHRGYEVYAAVRPESKVDHLSHWKINYVSPDFRSIEALKRNIEENQYDYIIHAAGVTKAKSELDYNNVNALYTKNLAFAASKFPVKKFVFVSSLAALGPTSYVDKEPIRESRSPRPITNYGKSKFLAEQWLTGINLPLIVLRPTAVYGPREKDILIMFKTLNRGFEPYIGNGRQSLSFVYVKDLAEVAFNALTSDFTQRTYNISDGRLYDRYDLANHTKELLMKKTLKLHVPLSIVKVIAGIMEKTSRGGTPALNKEKLGELTAENWNCSIENAQTDLAYAPKYDLKAGLRETIDWYKRNNWL